MAFTFYEENEPFVFTDTQEKAIPNDAIVDNRAAKTNYAMGATSPGVDELRLNFQNGGEDGFRQTEAYNEDLRDQQLKMSIITAAAQQNGRALAPEEMDIILGLSRDELRNDPADIIEKKFANKYLGDVFSSVDIYQGFNTEIDPAVVADESGIARDAIQWKEFSQTRLEDLNTKWDKQGWLSSGADFVGQLIPFLPWWRQAQALQKRPLHVGNVLMGKTVADNVQYLYALPMAQRKAAYEEAIKYLEGKNTLDALLFAQAVVSYSTSDEYLANAISLADYASAVSTVGKIAGRFGKAAATKAATPTLTGPEPQKLLTSTYEQPKLLTYQRKPGQTAKESDAFTKQTDLFGDQPEQGSFRFMSRPEQGAPTLESKLPPGKMRATHQTEFDIFGGPGEEFSLPAGRTKTRENGLFRDPGTGKIQRATSSFKQGELPLAKAEHQSSFDLLPPAIKQAVKEAEATQPVKDLRHGLADAVKATEGPKAPDPVEVLGAVGNVEQAGFLGALRRIVNPLGHGNKDVAKEVPTFSNPTGFFQDSKVISRARAQAMKTQLIKEGERLIDNFVDLARVSRLPMEALQVAKANAEAALRKDYARLNEAVLDITHTPADMAGAARVDVVTMKLGMPDKSLFPSKELAEKFRDEVFQLGKGEATPRQQGFGKWYLAVPRHLDETADNVRGSLITPKNTTPRGMINMLLDRLRSAEDLLSPLQREARHVATHAPQQLRAEIRQFVKDNIEGLSPASRRAVEDILRLNRDMPSTKYPGERGRWFDTAAEFETSFFGRHQRMPTEQEILAYDAFKRLSDFDWLIRNVFVYRDKARQGIERWQFKFDSETSGWFEGKVLDKMPWSLGNKTDQDAGVWIWHSESSTGRFLYKFDMDDSQRKFVDDLLKDKGYRIIQIAEAEKHPLKGIAKTAAGDDLKDQVNYVITNTWDRAPLSWKQVDYRPGGHVVYPHKWYVAQPTIQIGRNGKMTYFGDSNILNVETEAQARKWAERIDHGRQLLKLGREDELRTYLSKNLPYDMPQFKALFQRGDSPLSLDHPVTIKSGGKNTISTDTKLKAQYDNGNLIDSTKNVHNLSNWMDKSYLADRDNVLGTILEKSGTLQLGAAEQLDPYVALNKALGQGIQNLWMGDYKITAIESWIKEFQHVMQPTDKTLAAHPLFFLLNPQWRKVSEVAQADLVAAKAAQRAIVNFIGARSEFAGSIDAVKMKLLNSVYEKFGTGKMLDAALALSTKDQAADYLRGVAFHTKLGLFNPVQFFVQAQSMAHSIAVAGPKHGLPGFAAAPLLRALGHNPNQIDAIAGVASKLGWSVPQFKEMYQTFQKTGLYQVAGEAASRDDVFDPHLFRTALGKIVLEAGPMFFNEGERMVRLTAFATAFREWRAANPAIRIGDREIASMMLRTDDLSVNMTRASNASWQSGAFAVPTQFFAYNARIMEQMLGKRLTGAEKLRALVTYSALYGIPIGAGMSVGAVWPVYDSVKQEAMKRGIDLNEGAFKLMTEGLASYAIELMTGKQYNVAQRFGPGNNKELKDILAGDKGVLDVVFGASGTILGDIIKASQPFLYYAASVTQGNGEFTLTSHDWMAAARNISTMDVAAKSYAALAYGKWYTKSGTSVAEADTVDAFMVALGLSPLKVTDTFLQLRANKDTRERVATFEKQILEQFRLGMQAGVTGDQAKLETHFKNAHLLVEASDMNTEQQSALFRRIARQNRDLADQVKWDTLRTAPKSRYQSIFENYFKDKQ